METLMKRRNFMKHAGAAAAATGLGLTSVRAAELPKLWVS